MSHETKEASELSLLLPDLRRLAHILAPTHDAAEDMVQDALLSVWRQIVQGTDIETLRPYLMTALRNRSRRPTRKTQTLDSIAEPSHAPEAPARLATKEVLAAIYKLPRAQSELLADLAINEPSYSELAKRHNVPIGTVMSRLARARASLRLNLKVPKDGPTAALLADD